MIAAPSYRLFDGREYSKVIIWSSREKERAPGSAGRSSVLRLFPGLVLVDVGLDVAGSDDFERAIQDDVAGVRGLEDHKHGGVACSGLAVVDEFKENRVAVCVVESASPFGNDGVDGSRGRIGLFHECAGCLEEGRHVEVVAATFARVRPVDFEVVGGLMEVAIDFEALGDDDIAYRDLLTAASEAADSGRAICGDCDSDHSADIARGILIAPDADSNSLDIDCTSPLWCIDGSAELVGRHLCRGRQEGSGRQSGPVEEDVDFRVVPFAVGISWIPG